MNKKQQTLVDMMDDEALNMNSVGTKARNLSLMYRAGIIVPEIQFIPARLLVDDKPDLESFLSDVNLSKPLIVRSSCIEEDRAGFTYAGVFKSLVVDGNLDDLMNAVQIVTTHAKKLGATPALILQEYVQADFYGVGFTKFDMDNQSFLPIVEYSCTPEQVTIGTNEVERYVFLDNPRMELRPPHKFLENLYPIMDKIEQLTGTVQDVEFAAKGDNIVILQTRDCKFSANDVIWWRWARRKKTPIFPSNFRTRTTPEYKEKFGSENRCILVSRDDFLEICYHKEDIFNYQSAWLDDIAKNRPSLVKLEKEIDDQLWDLISFSDTLSESVSVEDRLKSLDRYEQLYSKSVSVTNNSLFGGMLLEQYLSSYLESWSHALPDDCSVADAFNILTRAEDKTSWAEKLRLSLVEFGDSNSELKSLITENLDFKSFSNYLLNSPETKNTWQKIHDEYHWIGFNWLGPGMDEEKMFNLFSRTILNPGSDSLVSYSKEELKSALDLSDDGVYLFNTLSHLIYLKDYRNGLYSKAAYNFYNWINGIMNEQVHSVDDSFNLTVDEIRTIIDGTADYNALELDKRAELSVWTMSDGKETLLYGEKATSFLKANGLDKKMIEVDPTLNYLQGTSANGGYVEGKIKIIEDSISENLTKEDIILATSFHPDETYNLISAGGVLIEEGGITSHIAILARELNIPCIIGISDLYQLKEGDSVIVDASKGRVYHKNLSEVNR
ncbi:MAG: hypothetical protein KKB65_06575 [Nanoarchaeota archaeon]|nr:hypothetical protein [Nanoarchaeota archaeon]MBU1030872.1 hypothetical protein [Nanoarchaeota archaeon]